MKQMLISIMTMATLLFAVSCTEEVKNNDLSGDKLEKDKYTFLKSAKAYDDASQKRSSDYSSEFDIVQIERVEDVLNVTLSYPAGCEDNHFEVIWDEKVLESYPEIIHIFIKRTTGNCDTSDETETTVLAIDLVECIGDEAMVDRASFIISNASNNVDFGDDDIISDKD